MTAAADSSLPRPVAGAAVGAVAPGGQALRQLALALPADPDAMAKGAPPIAGRLAAELIARGPAALAVPACAVCGRTGKPLTRGDDGTGVCRRCRAWQRAVACVSCGKVRPRAGRDSAGQPACEVCRRKLSPKRRRACGRCGKTAPIAVRGRDGNPDICVNCCKMPAATCSVCGRQKECNFAATSRPVCISCSPRATATCARCGQDRPPAARWPEGPVCDPCSIAALRYRGRCSACGQQRRPVTPPGPEADTRADCAGIPVTHACADCGTEDKLCEKGRCARCSLRCRARNLPSAGTGTIAPPPAGVLEAITAARQPRSALTWLRKGAGSGPLADVAAPGPLADAIHQLISHGRSHRGAGSRAAGTWLTPGHLPGRPITPSRLGERLRAIGIYAQTGRRAALLDLAAQLPAAVLADLPGLHETTAAKWIHQAGRDWTSYAAELSRSHPHQHRRIPAQRRAASRPIQHCW